MAEADAEDRDFSERGLDGLYRVIENRGISRSVADEQTVGPMLEDFFGADCLAEEPSP